MEDFREILREEFAERKARNPRFSLRSFARLINLSPSTVSEVLNGKALISIATAKTIAKKLQFPSVKERIFCTQVAWHQTKSSKQKDILLGELQDLRNARAKNHLSNDQFSYISDWYHLAIIELLSTSPEGLKSALIAKRLGLRPIYANEGLNRLSRLGLVTCHNGLWQTSSPHNEVVNHFPSMALQTYYRQLLEKAGVALSQQRREERDFSGYIFLIPKEKLGAIKDMLRENLDRIEVAVSKHQGGDSVYCLTTQLFRLDQEI